MAPVCDICHKKVLFFLKASLIEENEDNIELCIAPLDKVNFASRLWIA